MISKIEVYNFRCFRSLKLEGLKRVNLIVGENSSGKSSFLESIFLSSGTMAPHTVFQMRGIRKMGGQVAFPVDQQGYRALWEDLFFDFDEDKKVSIKIIGNPSSDGRSLRIEYVAPVGTQELPFEKLTAPSTAANRVQQTGMPQIEFKWRRDGHPEVIAKPKFVSTGMQVDTLADYFPCVWFTPGVAETPDENAKRYSHLDKRGELGPVKKAICKEFPFIQEISIDYHAGIPMLFAKVEGKSRKMPVPLISDGVNRLVGICLGLANFSGGTVLIDQLEDGFHHKLLPSIWKSIYTLADEFGVQVFVSSHSAECIEAMMEVVKEHPEDFALLRAIRKEPGCTIDFLDGKYLESALEQRFEVR
jgi:hypothetical protein